MAIDIEKLHRQFRENDFERIHFFDVAKLSVLERAKMSAAGISLPAVMPPAAMPKVSQLGHFGQRNINKPLDQVENLDHKRKNDLSK